MTTATIDITTFAPNALSADKLKRLNDLLDKLDVAVAARKQTLDEAKIKAAHSWLDDNLDTPAPTDHLAVYNAIPDDMFSQMFQAAVLDSEHGYFDEDVKAALLNLEASEQKEFLAYVNGHYAEFASAKELRHHWHSVSKLYRTIQKEFPGITNSKEDILLALEFGKVIHENKDELDKLWMPLKDNGWGGVNTFGDRADKVKELLEAAYPDDEVDNLFIGKAKLSKDGAAFLASSAVDVVIMGDLFNGVSKENPTWHLGLSMTTHEFQHRRQWRLIQKFERGEIEEGSAEYYQARLFHANKRGGYLSPIKAMGKIERFASFRDYMEQPVERHANDIEKITGVIGNPKGTALMSFNSKAMRVMSGLARPFHFASYSINRGIDWVRGEKTLESAPAPKI